jgi:hypothetical protein
MDEDIELFKQVENKKIDELRFSSTNINWKYKNK